jgi:hypothetical protein
VAHALVHRSFAVLLLFVGVAAVAATWLKVAQTLSDAVPQQPVAHPSAIVWSDRVFETPAALRAWLRSHGATYIAWSKQHGLAAATLEHVTPPIVTTQAAQTRTAVTTSAAQTRPAVTTQAAQPRPAVTTQAAQPRPAVTTPVHASPARPAASADATAPAHRAPQHSARAADVRLAIEMLLLLLAGGCAFTAVLPGPIRRRFPRVTAKVWPYRDLLGAGAAALVIGLAIGITLS